MVLTETVVVENKDEVGVICHKIMDTIHAVRTITTALPCELLDKVFLREGIGDDFRFGFIFGFARGECYKSKTQREKRKEMFHKIV